MKIAIPRERRAGENRVAASPETVKKLKALSLEVVVETGAGLGSNLPDRVYQDAGAEIAPDAASALADADIVLKVQRPLLAGEGDLDELALIKRGALLFAILNPYNSRDHVAAYAAAGVNAFAMEFMPRITRAQVMDVLSSQANLAGYKAVVDAASEYGRAYPMMMTAAGTVPPARAFIMGVGVAGLQAIATAKRLGAIVSATDVRPAVKEQVQSLGGSFVAVENDEFKQAETAGGYAKEMSDDYKRQQAALVAEHIKKQDIVITTALIPGRKAPILVTREHVASMKPGSVLIDLAVEQGGNVEGSELGKVVTTENGVKIVGHANYPSRIAESASLLYAKNLLALLQSLHDKDPEDNTKGRVTLNWDDEIVKAIALTRDGQVVHPAFAGQTV
ncbi:NAD(P) transhydrogenase subunit alpha [Azospirillum argentinense]|uniref:NAD(P) transhydrogenase subunit alpha part 1 n=5 Tax=Azospirillum TaxID=191 RepID=A0A060DH11_9PROT|nr:Re/Si-specific NAD(P)(+) transhydrogenase subunit alpha [Azospirillum argentinense]AIB12162.1 NAD(P) transhydrogenase subunit alpha [Azospirillum argentinense]EZQ09022.1 NAD(P) transhydrogenase subunit alpha [Azospirillum argentinense]PNQ96006.1 NAD(P)(+) transhydrogenase (Re/Si-specific) subunit alpha [Azospirillum argentinense]